MLTSEWFRACGPSSAGPVPPAPEEGGGKGTVGGGGGGGADKPPPPRERAQCTCAAGSMLVTAGEWSSSAQSIEMVRRTESVLCDTSREATAGGPALAHGRGVAFEVWHLRCGRGVAEVCGRDAAATQPRRSRGAAEIPPDGGRACYLDAARLRVADHLRLVGGEVAVLAARRGGGAGRVLAQANRRPAATAAACAAATAAAGNAVP